MNSDPIQNNFSTPFADVDEVSDEIFSRAIPLPSSEDQEPYTHEMPPSDELPASRTQGFTKMLLNSLSQLIASEGSHSVDKMGRPTVCVLVVDEEGRLVVSSATPSASLTEISPKKKSPGGLAHYLALPDNVKMLESEPSKHDEEATRAAIREVMIEQRRERSRGSFPELVPAVRRQSFSECFGCFVTEALVRFLFQFRRQRIGAAIGVFGMSVS